VCGEEPFQLLLARAQVALGIGLESPGALGQGVPVRDGGYQVLEGLRPRRCMDVAGRNDRAFQFPGQLCQPLVAMVVCLLKGTFRHQAQGAETGFQGFAMQAVFIAEAGAPEGNAVLVTQFQVLPPELVAPLGAASSPPGVIRWLRAA